jgi:PAS domain S-box-containing protein
MPCEHDGPGDEAVELQERYQRLVALAPDGILIHVGGTIVMTNPAAVRLLGAEGPDQVLGRPITDFLAPPYLKSLHDVIVGGRAPGSAEAASRLPPVRDTLRRLGGTSIEIELSATPFMDHGEPAAHLVFRDISERLRIQDRLNRAQQMEAIGAVAGGVAHEINNMMTVVLGFSDFLIRDVRLPQPLMGDALQIRQAATHAAAVTRDLLAFSRRAARAPRVLDLDSLVADAVPMLRTLLGNIRPVAFAPDCGCRVNVDSAQFRQVLVNLALNARDAMPAGGPVTISTGIRVVGDDEAQGGSGPVPGRYAQIVVADTGIGMDAATQARVFEPFFTTKPIGDGTGLGLAAVDGMMAQNGGGVSVESEPGHGTTFTLLLPIASDTDGAPVAANTPDGRKGTAPSAGATVLVVDDQPNVRAIAVRSLEAAGHRVMEAGDGRTALALLDSHGAPDLIVTDLVMPEMGGGALAREVEQRWPSVPVLFMSGYPREELVANRMLRPDAHLLSKPFSPEVLVQTVRVLIRAGR